MKFHLLRQLFNGERLSVIGERLSPYKDVIIFMITLFIANYFWKFTMVGDEDGAVVTWLGLNVTAPFDVMSRHIAAVVYWLVDLFRDTASMPDAYTIHFDSGSGTTVVWGCSGLKQSFIWILLMLTVVPWKDRKLWLQKLWYIPIGLVCCYVFNILRIFLISLFIEFHPEWFNVLHTYIFKYLFYGMLFGLWVIFVEKIRSSSSAS